MKEIIKSFVKKYYKILLTFTLCGLVGGFLIGLYLIDSYPAEIREQIIAQGIDGVALGIISGIQYAGYGLVLGAVGIVLANKIGLWRDEIVFEKKPIILGLIWGVIGGVALIGFDLLWFGREVVAIGESYLVKPSVAYILGSIILGGVVEEVMLRLFMMSLAAFLLLKIFKNCNIEAALIIANVVSAMLFAAGHLPVTDILFGLTPLVIFRCFLLNGGVGLAFGWLYRKHGIQYAMIAHAFCHVVSKLIWILFI